MSYKPRTAISLPTDAAMGKTGSWRDFRPTVDTSKCIKCLRCWIACPDACIKRDADDTISIDYVYCKGCGICANECPASAIRMTREGLGQ